MQGCRHDAQLFGCSYHGEELTIMEVNNGREHVISVNMALYNFVEKRYKLQKAHDLVLLKF